MIRSALFVPGDQLHLVDKLRCRPQDQQPDQLIVDLEDAVAPSAKPEARHAVARALAERQLGRDVVVRINVGTAGLDDLTAVCSSGDPMICIPKADAQSVSTVIGAIQAMRRVPRVWALVESAIGLRDLDRVCSTPGVERLALGEVDLCAELGLRPGAAHALWPLRMQLVTASASSGLLGPIGPVSVDFADLQQYERESQDLCDAGFDGRLAIHPNQLPIVHRVFTPSPVAVQRALRVVAIHREAVAAGRGTIVDDDGRMVDEAVVRTARRMLARVTLEEEP